MGVDLFGSHVSYELVNGPMPYLHMPKVYLFAWRWFEYLYLELLYFICSQFTPLLFESLYYFTMKVDTIWRRAVKHLKNRVVYLHHWQLHRFWVERCFVFIWAWRMVVMKVSWTPRLVSTYLLNCCAAAASDSCFIIIISSLAVPSRDVSDLFSWTSLNRCAFRLNNN